MEIQRDTRGIGASLTAILERLPVLSCCAKARGWHYVISWFQRFTGIALILILVVHLYTLFLHRPDVIHANLRVIVSSILLFFAWASSLVVGFHGLNGCRVILYELFGRRNDAEMIRWIFGMSAAYAAMVGLMMIMKNQTVSGFFFWMTAFFYGAVAAYVVASRIWKKRHSVLWKLQRISAAFLSITVPAYLLFLYLHRGQAQGEQAAVARMQDVFTHLVALTLAALALYHAGYGLFSIAADYISSRVMRAGVAALIFALMAVLAVLAFRVVLFA